MHVPEERVYPFELALRDVQAVGRPYRYLEGAAVPYDTWGDVGLFLEQHAGGSFRQSTKAGAGRRAPLLLFHDNARFPIGHAHSWTHDGALTGVWELNDSAEAQRAAKAAEDGDLTGLSVGFAPIRSDWAHVDDWAPELGPDHKDRVTRLESRLVEVSLTPTPVFTDAQVQMVRTLETIETRTARTGGPKVLLVDTWREWVDGVRSGPALDRG